MHFFLSSIDAIYSTSIARFINDSPNEFSNCKMEKIVEDGKPHLILVAKVEIQENTELRYDYGDRKNLWWRQNVWAVVLFLFFVTLSLTIWKMTKNMTPEKFCLY